MMKDKIKSSRGVTLISLTIVVAVLMILANVIIYNVGDNLKVGKLKEMQNDIDNLRAKISDYYVQNGKIPASIKYTNIYHLKEAGIISDAVDTGNFLVIDLSALDNLTLNRGKDFEEIKFFDSLTEEQAKNNTDLYIINETSHNIFYVAGITIDKETFYTDYTQENMDQVSVDLKYVEGIKIPDGFYYVEGTKDTGILIRANNATQEYLWVQTKEKITAIPDKVEITTRETENFIKSVNSYSGYYKSTTSNEVMYLELENWSPKYDKEGIYKDKNGDTAYIPEGFQVSKLSGENTIHEGLVVKDRNHNEWVWIEVPKTKTVYQTAGIDIIDFTEEDYTKIETDLQTYAKVYRDSNYKDTWALEEQHGFSSENEYHDLKNSMLKSVYEKGGFYIGRYEVGTQTQRIDNLTELTTPVIQRDAYPYNFVTCKQAQAKSKELATAERTTSLMFGIQWDLVLKFIEVKGQRLQNEITLDSSSWGNYSNITFNVVRGKYTNNPNLGNSYVDVNESYSKLEKTDILLTTGATNRNTALNIYDIAGNLYEWTLENNVTDFNGSCVYRGGSYYRDGATPASSYGTASALDFFNNVGFRPTLY